VILTIEPLGVPTLQSCFQGEGKKDPICASLNTDSTNYLAVGRTRLVL
jgi:hypothetical protein